MRGRSDISAAQSQGTWLGKLQALAPNVALWNGGPQHDMLMMQLIILLFDVPEAWYTPDLLFDGQHNGAGFEVRNVYTRVRDPGNMRHIFQNHESFMAIVRETVFANRLDVAVLENHMQAYRTLETQLLAKQLVLISEFPAKCGGRRGDGSANAAQTAHLTQLLSRLNMDW
jgi:hypothetical protein